MNTTQESYQRIQKLLNKASKDKLANGLSLLPSRKYYSSYPEFPFQPKEDQSYEEWRQDILKYWEVNKRFSRKEAATRLEDKLLAFYSSPKGQKSIQDQQRNFIFFSKPHQYLNLSIPSASNHLTFLRIFPQHNTAPWKPRKL